MIVLIFRYERISSDWKRPEKQPFKDVVRLCDMYFFLLVTFMKNTNAISNAINKIYDCLKPETGYYVWIWTIAIRIFLSVIVVNC